MGEMARVHIDGNAYKGYGVTRIDGKVVFIPATVKGDDAWIEIIEERKRFAFGRLREILNPSPWRVSPSCQYFGECGACQWQHIDYHFHGELKKGIFKEILNRLGRLKEIPPLHVELSPKSYAYRVRVQLKVRGEKLGYYRRGSHTMIEVDHCPISHPLVNLILQDLRTDPPLLSKTAEVEINVSPEEGKGVLICHPHSLHPRTEHQWMGLAQKFPIVKGFGIVREKQMILLGDPYLWYSIPLDMNGGKRTLVFRTSPESFFQINLEQNQRLIQTVLQFSEVKGKEKVLDLYCGVGNLTLPLALMAQEVLGIEENRGSIEDARVNAKKNGIRNCSFLHGRVEEILKNLEMKPDLVVLDPPRTGSKTILDQMIQMAPRKIVYVSCEPTTFSRDLHHLRERGYVLQRMSLIDMFPQTYHMEVVGLLQHFHGSSEG